MKSYFSFNSVNFLRKYSPISLLCSTRFSSSNTSKTAFAAAPASGLPAKVVPWSPGTKPPATSSFAKNAAIGNPPPIPLATVMISASMPNNS